MDGLRGKLKPSRSLKVAHWPSAHWKWTFFSFFQLWRPLHRKPSEFNFRNTLVISIPINIWSSSGNAEFFFFLLFGTLWFWVKTLRPKFPGFQNRSGLAWDRDFQTQSQYVTICCPILHARDGEFYSIHNICFGFLKSEFSHCKSVKTGELWRPLSRERSEFNFRNTMLISIPINI